MFDKEGIKNYVRLYKSILSKHQIIVPDKDLSNIYKLIVLTFELDDLYDSVDKAFNKVELEAIKKEMISLMPNRHPIALHSIEIVFKAMDDEAHSNLNQSLDSYLRVCSKSIGAQIIAGYLASKTCINLNIWLSKIIAKFNNEIDDIIRLANDYLDITVDARRMSEESPQIKAINFFRCKFEFKSYLCCRYLFHKVHYYLYLVGFKYFHISPQWKDYIGAISCSESVLDFAVKAYITDKKSCREPAY